MFDLITKNSIISYMGTVPVPLFPNLYWRCKMESLFEITKKCSKCGQEKPLDQFYKYKKAKDRLNYWCKECSNAQQIEWRKANRKKRCEYSSRWRSKNYQKNKRYNIKYIETWRISPQGIISIAKTRIKREKAYKNIINDLTLNDWLKIKKAQDYKCAYCGEKEPEIKLTMDHIIPLSKKGHHTKNNIQGLCCSCNSKKNNRIDSTAMELILNQEVNP